MLLQIVLRNKQEIICISLDFVFLSLVLWGKSLSNITCLFLLCLPLINCSTFSLKRYSTFPVFLLFLFSYALLTYSVSHTLLIGDIVLPTIASGIFLYYSGWVRRYFRNDLEVQEAIIDYASSTDNFFTLYEKILNIFNKSVILTRKRYKAIICLYTNDFNSYNLINSSYPLLSYKAVYSDKDVKQFMDSIPVTKYDDSRKSYSITFPVKQRASGVRRSEGFYLFVVITDFPVFFFNSNTPHLIRFFKGISRILATSYYNSVKWHERNKEILANYSYVRRAVNTMHYVRNKLTPIRVLIDITKDVPSTIEKDDIVKELKKYASKADNDLNQLLKQADFLLDPSKDPYRFDKDVVKLSDFLFQVKSIWNLYYVDDLFISNYDERDDNKMVEICSRGLELVLSDILGNMVKHSDGERRCDVKVLEDKTEVKFLNSFSSSSISEIKDLVADYNANRKDEILFRSTHGVINIKLLSDKMGIPLNASIEENENSRYFTITLSFVYYEKDPCC